MRWQTPQLVNLNPPKVCHSNQVFLTQWKSKNFSTTYFFMKSTMAP